MSRRSTVLLLAALVASAAPAAASAQTPSAQTPSATALSARHRLLLAAARELAAQVGERVWPGWDAEMEVLLLDGEREVLLGGSRRPDGFQPLGYDPKLGALAVRDPVFPPNLLATMPVFGPPPTLVVGTPETTGRSSGVWLQALLHEHFHQWQMSLPDYYADVAALDLAAGDTTGRWMLEYPFPYTDARIGRAFAASSRELAALLRRPAGEGLSAQAAGFWAGFDSWQRLLAPADARYLQFQLWQEGVARFVELRVAEEAAARWRPPADLLALADFEDFGALACAAWEELFEALEAPDLERRRRVSFYAFGAGMALLLDRTEPGWKRRIERRRFVLAPAAAAD